MKTKHTDSYDAYSLAKALGHWASFLLPLLVVLSMAGIFLREEVVRSIESSQHPELVYAILLAFFAGVVLSALTLSRYARERRLLSQWTHASKEERGQLLKRRAKGSYLLPLYALLHGQRAVASGTRQSVLEQEMAGIQARLQERLTLPQYLAGALVGLGLVGTFIGLLGTLEDLGKIFGSLAGTSVTDVSDPAQLFTDMVRRLQDPMRGMGTAFLASLYGLLGSLLLGLQILMVAKVEQGLGEQIHQLLRQDDQALPGHAGVATTNLQPFSFDQGLQGRQMADAVAALQAMQQGMPDQAALGRQMADAVAALQAMQQGMPDQAVLGRQMADAVAAMQAIHQALPDQSLLARQMTEAMATMQAMHQAQAQQWQALLQTMLEQQRSSQHDNEALRREVLGVADAANTLMASMRQSLLADERYRASVPRTTYWQDAWVKVQAYLQRSNTDQSLAQLAEISRAQVQALADMGSTITNIEQRLRSHLGPHRPDSAD